MVLLELSVCVLGRVYNYRTPLLLWELLSVILIDMEAEEDLDMDLLELESEDAKDAATEITVDVEHYQPGQVKQEPELVHVKENDPQEDSCAVTRSLPVTGAAAVCGEPCGLQDESVWYSVRSCPNPRA